MLQALAPIGGAAGPVGAIVAGVVSAIASLFGLFHGGVSGAVKSALEGLRGTLATVSDALKRFTWQLGRAVARILTTIHDLWTKVLYPILEKIQNLLRRVYRLIDKVLRPYIQFIERVRRQILEIYERFFRPVILAIERFRQMLTVFKLLHMKWAERLDRRLARLEAKVYAPIAVLLQQTALAARWLNVIVSVEQLFQQTIFGNSVWEHRNILVNHFLNALEAPPDPARDERVLAAKGGLTAPEASAALQALLLYHSGPLATNVSEAVAKLRAELRV